MVHGRTWRARNSARAREPGGGGAMGRRSTVDRSPQSDIYNADYVAGTGDLAQGDGRKDRIASGWRGAGGRWLVWVFRVVVWLVLLLIGYRGVTAIMEGGTSSGSAPAPAASPGNAFPSALGGAPGTRGFSRQRLSLGAGGRLRHAVRTGVPERGSGHGQPACQRTGYVPAGGRRFPARLERD